MMGTSWDLKLQLLKKKNDMLHDQIGGGSAELKPIKRGEGLDLDLRIDHFCQIHTCAAAAAATCYCGKLSALEKNLR